MARSPLTRILEAAETLGLNVREYSGRGMYGRTCIGVRTDYPEDLIAEAGVKGARTDSMGKSEIVYWPSVEFVDGRADLRGAL